MKKGGEFLVGNLFRAIPPGGTEESFESLVEQGAVTIERIVSHGQRSPKSGWYDQDRDEWVALLSGAATLVFSDGEEVQLTVGDYLTIPAHCRHKVSWTHPDKATVWLAVHY